MWQNKTELIFATICVANKDKLIFCHSLRRCKIKGIKMKNRNKFIVLIAIVGSIIGTLLKLQNHKISGDVLLGISTLFWLYFIFTVLFFKKKKTV